LLPGALSGCSKPDSEAVVATANGIGITKIEFEHFLQMRLGELAEPGVSDSIRSQMLDEYIRRRLIVSAAGAAGLSVTAADVEQAAIENPQVKSAAADSEARRELENDLLIAKYYRQIVLQDVRVSAEEVQQHLEQNKSLVKDRPGFYVREIRVDTQEEAEKLKREITAGNRDFADLARQHSQAPNAGQGGLARYVQGQLPAVLERAIQALRPGDVSQIVQSSFGYHIFKLERRIQPAAADERRPVLSEQQSNMIEELIVRKNQEAVDQAIDRIVSSADIRIDESALGFPYEGRLRHNQ
jgi:parvulin-like peptidyl-prolyl isomerase